MRSHRAAATRLELGAVIASIVVALALAGLYARYGSRADRSGGAAAPLPAPAGRAGGALAPPAAGGGHQVSFQPREINDTGGFYAILASLRPWAPDASLEDIARSWD